jgi:hypothetical protein
VTRRSDGRARRPQRPRAEATPVAPGRRFAPALELFLYAALALAWTWPLGRVLANAIPIGSEPAATVPLLNLWTMWWNADRIEHLYADYWEAPIFHPAPHSFALSEPQPLAGAFAAACAAAGAPLLAAYNLFLLLSLTLNGWAAGRLLRAAGLGPLAAAAGGAMTTTLPFVHQELGVLQLVPLYGIAWALHALLRLHAEPTLRRGAHLGAAIGVTGLLCAYYGLFLSALLAPACLLLLAGRDRRRAYGGPLLLAWLLAAALLGPLALGQLRAAKEHAMRRSEQSQLKNSARLTDYARTPWAPIVRVPGVKAADSGEKALFPGPFKALLAVAGLVHGLRAPARRRFAALCAVLLVLAIALSLGPGTGLIGLVPGASHVRSPFRFAVFAQLVAVFLAALGLEATLARVRHRSARGLAAATLAALVVCEVRPAAARLQPLPPLETAVPWIDGIQARTEPEDVLAFLPFPAGRSALDYLETSQWMFWQMRHGRRMVNGYSGFFPERFLSLKSAMQRFPDARSIRALAERGVRYVVVPRFVAGRSAVEAASDPPHRLRWHFGDESNGIDVYSLER